MLSFYLVPVRTMEIMLPFLLLNCNSFNIMFIDLLNMSLFMLLLGFINSYHDKHDIKDLTH